jgi:hypothetical protein
MQLQNMARLHLSIYELEIHEPNCLSGLKKTSNTVGNMSMSLYRSTDSLYKIKFGSDHLILL